MPTLTTTSFQAQNADAGIAAIAQWLTTQLDCVVQFDGDADFSLRERRFNKQQTDFAWMCGANYIPRKDRGEAVELLCAPVMEGERHDDKPVYFSDVVVSAESPHQSFADLRGCRWAINEPQSHSGCYIAAYHLATLGEDWSYFGEVVQSGGHQLSLAGIAAGIYDASAIDSTTMETELRLIPELADKVRVIATLGPSPIPVWVIGKHIPEAVRVQIRDAMLSMHLDDVGAAILKEHNYVRLAAVTDADYDPMREMRRLAATIGRPPIVA